MENKLTLENIQGFLSYGIKFMAYETVYTAIGATKTGVCIDSTTEYAIGDCKPILRKMDLTKPIIVEGKKIIPIVELLEIASDLKSSGGLLPGIKTELNYEDGVSNIEVIFNKKLELTYFNNDSSFFMSVDGITYSLHNTLSLFKWLYKHKFDVDGLCEKGLAIDADSLEINPYNN